MWVNSFFLLFFNCLAHCFGSPSRSCSLSFYTSPGLVEDQSLMLSGLCLQLRASAASVNHICFSVAFLLTSSSSFSHRSPSFSLNLPSIFHFSVFLCLCLPRDGETAQGGRGAAFPQTGWWSTTSNVLLGEAEAKYEGNSASKQKQLHMKTVDAKRKMRLLSKRYSNTNN